MAIWDSLLQKAIRPQINKAIEDYKKDQVEKGLQYMSSGNNQPVPLGAGKSTAKNRPTPAGVNFNTLRSFSLYYPILRACINYRKRQLTSLAWDITPVEVDLKAKQKKDEKVEGEIKEIKNFLKHPTGEKNSHFSGFLNKIIEDLLVLDATAIYKRSTRGGGIYGYVPLDGASIELVLNTDGSIPPPPRTAYIQKVNGKIVAKLNSEELIYRMMNPRTTTPYGLSPVETLIVTVSTALKLSAHNLNSLTEGNVPEGFVELPKDVASNQDQLKQWQEAWDAMFTGNPAYQRKIKFLPEGMKWTSTRKPEDMEFDRFEKWLLMQTCSVMEVAPQAIGFQFDRGKGATETEWEIGKERGLFPLANFIKEFLDEIIQEDMGMDKYEFVWTNVNPTNKKEEAEVFSQLVKTGAVSVDEWRIGEGFPPIGLAHMIMTPVGPIMVKDLVDASEAGTPLIPYNYTQGAGGNAALQGGGGKGFSPDSTAGGGAKPSVKEPPPEAKPAAKPAAPAKKIDTVEFVDELKRWKKVVVKDYKAGQSFRDFKSTIIDPRTQRLIKDGLHRIEDRKDLDELFDPLISQESNILQEVINLYDTVTQLTQHDEPAATQ